MDFVNQDSSTIAQDTSTLPEVNWGTAGGNWTPAAPAQDWMPVYESAPVDTFEQAWYDATNYADGGLVKKAEGYADGGTVRAGGSRRSANPEVEILSPEQSIANNFQEARVGSPVASASGSDIINSLASYGALQSGGDGFSGNAGTDTGTGSLSGRDVAGAIGKLGAVNTISGVSGGSTIMSDAMRGLGLVGSLASAQTPEQALGAMARSVLGFASPGLANLAGFTMNPTQVNAVNLATTLNPYTAAINAGLGLVGTSLGAVALGTPQSITGSTVSGGLVNEATPGVFGGLFGAGGQFGGNPAMSSPVTGWGEVATTDLGLLGFDTSGGNNGGGGTNADGGTGDTGSDGVGGGGTGDSDASDNGMADGGIPEGVADNIDISVSEGEYIVSADVVETLGEDFFNQLQAAFHTPASQQRQKQVQQRV
jgi:hypothetical protein